jgi:hypothetical protein
LPWIDEGWQIDRNVHAALVLTEEGLQGHLFGGDDPAGKMLEFAETHEGVAVGHIDCVVHDTAWTQAVVVDVKSTVWSDSFASGERVWTQKYPPKDSHCLQVATYDRDCSSSISGAKKRAGRKWSGAPWKTRFGSVWSMCSRRPILPTTRRKQSRIPGHARRMGNRGHAVRLVKRHIAHISRALHTPRIKSR